MWTKSHFCRRSISCANILCLSCCITIQLRLSLSAKPLIFGEFWLRWLWYFALTCVYIMATNECQRSHQRENKRKAKSERTCGLVVENSKLNQNNVKLNLMLVIIERRERIWITWSNISMWHQCEFFVCHPKIYLFCFYCERWQPKCWLQTLSAIHFSQ